MGEESLELIRERNIRRNKDLLNKLNIDDLFKSASPLTPSSGRGRPRSTGQKPKISKAIPVRRSRRLANTPELELEVKKEEKAAEISRLAEEARIAKRNQRLTDRFSLVDLVADIRSGQLKYEERVFKRNENVAEIINEEESDQALIDQIARLANVELNPFYSNPVCEKSDDTTSLATKKEFQELKIFPQDSSNIKLTLLRITSLHFHLTIRDRLIVAGDTTGNIGIWSVDQTVEDNELLLVAFKPHGKTVSRVAEVPFSPTQIMTASYDGSVRLTDLVKQENISIMSLNDNEELPLGISDISVPFDLPQQIYITSLDGQFYRQDTRESRRATNYKKLIRLHDKKIGGFTINPNNCFQMASASLDRSLRLWDLRYISKKYLLSEFDEKATSPHFYGGYSSKLSISAVDWNSENRLVCNGYDNTIRIFNLSGNKDDPGIDSWNKGFRIGGKNHDGLYALSADKTIRHNCQTGRWVSILKARWQKSPQDSIQKFVIGSMNRSFDIYDQQGSLIASLADPNKMTAVPAVVSFHPTHNWIVGGTSSGKVYLYA